MTEALFRLNAADYRRGLFAGVAWGAVLASGLALMGAECMTVANAVTTTALSIAGGIALIGPIAIFGAPRPAPAQ